jgi:hypothetical protein
MKRILVSILFLAVGGYVAFCWLVPSIPVPDPRVIPTPSGVSQTTVREVAIRRPEWLSPSQERVWVECRFGETDIHFAHLLIELETGRTPFQILEGTPLAWLDEDRVLVLHQGSTDPNWKKIFRRIGASTPRQFVSRFSVFSLTSGSSAVLCEAETGRPMTSFTLSPDRHRAVATWGNQLAHEIDLEKGTLSPALGEPFVWSPCFIDNSTYAFVGETTIQSRQFGESETERISQPMLPEIRDSIIEKGAPSLRLIGQEGGFFLALDQYPTRDYDRLLSLNTATSLVDELTRLKSSTEIPRFNSEGTRMVYQGNIFEGDMDTVYLQEVAEDSEPVILVEGKQGHANESTPLFLAGDRVLYVHWGTEVRSTDSKLDSEPRIHWPLSLVPGVSTD